MATTATHTNSKRLQKAAMLFVLAFAVLQGLTSIANAQGPAGRVKSQAQVAVSKATPTPTPTPSPTPVPAKKRRAIVLWNISLEGDKFTDERNQAQVAGFGVGGRLRYHLLEGLEIKVGASVALQSGYAQTQFGDSAPFTGLALQEALVQYRPWTPLMFEAGALNQGELNLPLLVSARPFPGVAEEVLLGGRRFGAELMAQQTVPTSTSLSTKTVDQEASPSFTTETLQFRMMPIEWWTLKVSGTHWAFHNLPSQVAQDSATFGNTLSGDGLHFLYEYQGYAAGGSSTIQFAKEFAWTVEGQTMQNLSAPDSYRNGQLYATSFNIGLPKDIDVIPRAEMFFAESDVAPAFYTDAGYGHTNRQGWAAEIATKFKTAGFKLAGRFVNADVINENLVQTQQQYFMIRFETLYDSLF